MPTSRPLSCPLTVTVAPKLPLSLATGSIRVRVPVTVSSVASLVMLHCRPVLSLPTELAGIVTSTVRLSTSWIVATVPLHAAPTVASSAVIVPSIVAVRVQFSSAVCSLVRVSSSRWDCASFVSALSTLRDALVALF